jgi:hypothetical protein
VPGRPTFRPERDQLELLRTLPGSLAPRKAQDLMAYPFFSRSESRRVTPINIRMGKVAVRVEAMPDHVHKRGAGIPRNTDATGIYSSDRSCFSELCDWETRYQKPCEWPPNGRNHCARELQKIGRRRASRMPLPQFFRSVQERPALYGEADRHRTKAKAPCCRRRLSLVTSARQIAATGTPLGRKLSPCRHLARGGAP